MNASTSGCHIDNAAPWHDPATLTTRLAGSIERAMHQAGAMALSDHDRVWALLAIGQNAVLDILTWEVDEGLPGHLWVALVRPADWRDLPGMLRPLSGLSARSTRSSWRGGEKSLYCLPTEADAAILATWFARRAMAEIGDLGDPSPRAEEMVIPGGPPALMFDDRLVDSFLTPGAWARVKASHNN